ncbi:MAG: hypothetical protein IPL39_14335 [Opitutaceae bacterium]|nr:hypothetical protein [Opitutaceae bacterium]
MDYWLDLQGGQKTGFHLDQTREHAKVAREAAGRRVLDWLSATRAASPCMPPRPGPRVLGLDSSEEAVVQARRNAERNGSPRSSRW